ncbi:methylmalonyl Co-A mutase-associated GTPase MeaB [Pseudotenacibaculum sp. MALMAid0570]|uniref:methylmalonyl Co-A mutase-associated GTPase MeaB n=1 Tax=Pseudotenacibaculum sp. MALMAid0570 TaxID=3143938 RepID=UPI0032DE5E9E
MAKKKASSLQDKDGVSQPETTSKSSAKKIQSQRSKQPTAKEFISGILEGNISLLSRAITLVESTNTKHQEKANEILNACLPYANSSVRVGITGVPGVGKSTFIEAYGKYLTNKGKKVAVLAVDPSSSINKGSILGDKTRMEQLVTDKNAFIRPSPSGTSLGGVAQKTRESIILCEAAGYDTIIIETVGVGQSETMVHSMVDFFLLLKIAGAGDELQGIKRGIIEMADAIVINKSDGENVKNTKIAKVEFNRALHLYPPKESGWQPKVLTASALKNIGIDNVQEMIEEYIEFTKENGYFDSKRNEQTQFWLESTIKEGLYNSFFKNKLISETLKQEIDRLKNGESTPFSSAQKLLKLYNERS